MDAQLVERLNGGDILIRTPRGSLVVTREEGQTIGGLLLNVEKDKIAQDGQDAIPKPE